MTISRAGLKTIGSIGGRPCLPRRAACGAHRLVWLALLVLSRLKAANDRKPVPMKALTQRAAVREADRTARLHRLEPLAQVCRAGHGIHRGGGRTGLGVGAGAPRHAPAVGHAVRSHFQHAATRACHCNAVAGRCGTGWNAAACGGQRRRVGPPRRCRAVGGAACASSPRPWVPVWTTAASRATRRCPSGCGDLARANVPVKDHRSDQPTFHGSSPRVPHPIPRLVHR